MPSLAPIQNGENLTSGQQLRLLLHLSLPAILAQLSSIVMQYIDAAMVGRLGAEASASIGLVSTTLWLFWGVCSAATVGFSVQVAHRLGARDTEGARVVRRTAMWTSFAFGSVMGAVGLILAPHLPHLLGGDATICADASLYFGLFTGALPLLIFNYLCSGLLRSTGNMKVPATVNVVMCFLDVLFNYFLIFPSHTFGSFTLPGAGLGVAGAALGTVCAEVCAVGFLLWYTLFRDKELSVRHPRKGATHREELKKVLGSWIKISSPLTLQHMVFCAAQIVSTLIVAPLGIIAIAANSFAITAESLCYMPCHGISEAATTLVGQSLGAGRRALMRRFAFLAAGLGIAAMVVMGTVMYILAPEMMMLFTPDEGIRTLGAEVLRIEAFAEPLYGASIVCYGIFVGAADTKVPLLINFGSIWCVRLTLAALLAPTMGLHGVWLAMCIELCFRGSMFLLRLRKFH